MKNGDKILITGGAGFIGSHLSDHFVNLGYKVVILDDLSTGKIENVSREIKFIKGSINDLEKLEIAFDGVSLCYHLAAIPSVEKSISSWLAVHDVNLSGTIKVFHVASQKNVPVIYASSAAIYGEPLSLPLSENSYPNFLSPYGLDKYTSELQAKLFGKIHGLKSLGMRFFNVYGPRQDPRSSYSGVISIFCNQIKNDNEIAIFGDGAQERDFIYIDDVIECLDISRNFLSEEGLVFNVCTGIGSSINTLVDNLFSLYQKNVKVNYFPFRSGDIYKSIGNPEYSKLKLGFQSKYNLIKGLSKLIRSD
jgi:UDP-glucose 4-epimerase